MRTPSLYSQDDPISAALKPSPTETELERQARLEAEAEAKRISEQIDDDLREERERLKRRKGDVKLLLLGQAESGKSTLQKQFQLMYKPNSLDQERASWTTVIYFNVVHSLKHILSTLDVWEDSLDGADVNYDDSARRTNGSTTPRDESADGPKNNAVQIANLRRRLSPLIATDEQLANRLTGGITVSGSGKGSVYVRSGWQARTIENALGKVRRRPSGEEKKSQEGLVHEHQDPLVQEVGRMLQLCESDIQELWNHPTVKGLMAKRKLKLDEWSEFFLRDIHRVAAPDYIPTTDDILHARVQTMGVAEHTFDVNLHGKTVTWHLYDVGGARGQRHTWVPYFDDANAIIFVAPVSAFDQYLEEDPRTNRIDDSLQLFTQICSNALLKNVHLVLFLNKTDLLKAKLEKGLKVKK
ncbi:guanine nucleotide-binding protein alpha-1 subunit [Coprinopsis cinerea okayama7|uniref:Guanine nucleotide-binding protein alpha-1 subunit n=1 Tax=Coprinopsis cinerea (strain Okayama-7 / 130 / ATCC MYA-4618 / FGSC 9003) TaxID=240176 RepID=A8P449_COPC7|nr:guanine nucleotide-binding protein alpha-1 subunit [Coprinopsis cinerea okayama7\|eukprot:XP_001838680.1 guanine nucleotide-binding protein alpha-1 subunit [Coprinopsis cinerea okayama7\